MAKSRIISFLRLSTTRELLELINGLEDACNRRNRRVSSSYFLKGLLIETVAFNPSVLLGFTILTFG